MIIANFINKQDALVTGLDQYDYGQVLRIQGLKLPTAVEIHFGLEETGGTTTTRIGVTKDGVTDVPIPDSMLENGDTSLDYTIYAFVYLTDETSGKTTKRIKIQVKARSKPELLNKPEDKELFQKAIEAVNRSAKEAEGWAHGREDMPERATDNAKYYAGESAKSAESVKGVEQNVKDMVATIGGIEQQVQDVKEYTGQAKIAAENALLSEQESKKSEEASLQHRTGAETAENNAELAESNAKKSEQAVEQAKQLVMQMGQEVLQNKNQVDGKVETFNKVVTDAVDAVGAVKTDAVGAVETKGTEQVKMVSDEGAKQVKAVEDKGNEVLQSIPEDFITQMESKLNKQQGVENKGKALVVGDDGNVAVGEVTGGDGIPIINTMSGESPLVVPDSAERVNKGFSLIGKSEQLQTTGKNLFDKEKAAIAESYTTTEQLTSIDISNAIVFDVKKNTDYCLSVTGKARKPTVNLNIANDNQRKSIMNELKMTETVNSLDSGKIYIGFSGGELSANIQNLPKEYFDIQLEEGKLSSKYEPYTGLKPSPSPDYPQEIKSVGKLNEDTGKYEVDVKVTGKNLFDKEKVEETLPIVIYYYLPIYVKKGAKISVSCKKLSSGLGFYALLSKEKGVVNNPYSWLYHSSATNLIVDKVTFTAESDIIYFNFSGNKQSLITELANFLQIEISNAPTEYQPYKEQTLTLTSDRPLTKWDKLVEQDAQIGWLYQSAIDNDVKPSRKDLFPGDFYLYKAHEKGTYTYNVSNEKKEIGYQTSLCKQFKNVNGSCNTGDLFHYSDQPSLKTQYFSTDIPTVEEFKQWMENNPLTMVYKTKTPEFVSLPQSEQETIRALITYCPTTVITTDGGEVDPDIEVTYIADTKNYIDQKIAAIGKTVVETQKALL